MHGIVAEGHFVRVVALIPFHVAILEKDVLALAVSLPILGRRSVVIAADAILGVIVLVGVVQGERGSDGVAGQDESVGN